MPAAQLALNQNDGPESKALVVAISVLQLALVVLVWMLALVPAAILALGALAVGGLRGWGRKWGRAPARLDLRS